MSPRPLRLSEARWDSRGSWRRWGDQARSRTGLPGPSLSAHSSNILHTARLQDVGTGGETGAETGGHRTDPRPRQDSGTKLAGRRRHSSVPFGAASTGPPGCFSTPDGAGMAARTPLYLLRGEEIGRWAPSLQPIPRAPRSPLLPLMQSLPLSSSYLGSPRRAARPLTIPERSVGGPRWH